MSKREGQSRHARKEDRNRRRRKGVVTAKNRKRVKRERRATHATLMARNDPPAKGEGD
jgi:hypothetical protein